MVGLQLNMVTICLQCGVEGWRNAFVYCVKCLNKAVHRYCLDVIPETFDEFVLWVCDVCEEESQKSTRSNSDAKTQGKTCSKPIEVDFTITLNKKRISHLAEWVENGHCENGAVLQSPHKELDSGKDVNTEGKRCSEQIEVDSTITLKRKKISHSTERVENGHCKNGSGLQSTDKKVNSSKDAKTEGKMCSEQIEVDSTITLNKKRISHLTEKVENMAGLQSSHKESDSSKDAELVCQYRPSRAGTKNVDDCSHMVLMNNEPRSPSNSSEPQKAKMVEGVANGLSKKAKLRKLNELSLLVTTNQSRSSDSAEFDEDVPLVSLSLLATSRNKDVSCSVDNFAEQKCENVPALQPHKQGQGYNYEREIEPTEELPEASCDKNDAISQPIVAASENIPRAKPLADPIWRGNFNILNQDDTVEGLAAHLSSKACRMVYNEASLLPMSLHLKILPKDVVWPKSFEKSDPTDDNIAMYIFPTDPRYASPFDLLVTKMTEQELAMRAVTKNAELLIFSSTELPLSYWKFRENCYLWGVFRGKTSLLSSRAVGDPVLPV